jgi:predicted nucleic acid-binding protein
MIVLDTNVVSEAMRPEPDVKVLAWLNEQAAETLYISSVTLAELLFGIAALPEGRRKTQLARTLDGVMGLFEGRILAFDAQAARHYAELAVRAKKQPSGITDARWIHRRHRGFAGLPGRVPRHRAV